MNGAGALKTIVDALIVAVAPAVAAYALTAARSVSCRCTVGTKWKSALSEFGLVLTQDHPDAAGFLHREALVDAGVRCRGRRRTILPATFAGSSAGVPPLSTAAKQSATAVALAPGKAGRPSSR